MDLEKDIESLYKAEAYNDKAVNNMLGWIGLGKYEYLIALIYWAESRKVLQEEESIKIRLKAVNAYLSYDMAVKGVLIKNAKVLQDFYFTNLVICVVSKLFKDLVNSSSKFSVSLSYKDYVRDLLDLLYNEGILDDTIYTSAYSMIISGSLSYGKDSSKGLEDFYNKFLEELSGRYVKDGKELYYDWYSERLNSVLEGGAM